MPKRVKVQLDHDGRAYYVPLPTYQMVPGSFAPVTPGVLGPDGPLASVPVANVLALTPTVLVDIPDEDYPDKPAGDGQWKAHLDNRYKEKPGGYGPKQK